MHIVGTLILFPPMKGLFSRHELVVDYSHTSRSREPDMGKHVGRHALVFEQSFMCHLLVIH